MKKPVDPFEQFRNQPGVLIFDVPVPEDLELEVAERILGEDFGNFSILQAMPYRGFVTVAYSTSDKLTLANFEGGRGRGTWPPDLVMTLQRIVGGLREAQVERERERRREADERHAEAMWNAAQAQRKAIEEEKTRRKQEIRQAAEAARGAA